MADLKSDQHNKMAIVYFLSYTNKQVSWSHARTALYYVSFISSGELSFSYDVLGRVLKWAAAVQLVLPKVLFLAFCGHFESDVGKLYFFLLGYVWDWQSYGGLNSWASVGVATLNSPRLRLFLHCLFNIYYLFCCLLFWVFFLVVVVGCGCCCCWLLDRLYFGRHISSKDNHIFQGGDGQPE